MVTLNKDHIELVAKEVLRWPANRKWNSADKDRRLRSFFGAPSNVIADLWNRLVNLTRMQQGGQPKHLLWALVFLKNYSTSELLCSIVGWPNTTTYSKWTWYFVRKIAALKDSIISLDHRFDGLNGVANTNCFISVDGTDCPVFEPTPFSKGMYSHKLNGPGVKYEVAVCLKTSHIVWINGPFIGSENDRTIFKNGLSNQLHDEEAVEVDAGYKGDDKMKGPSVGINLKVRKMKSVARS